MVRTTRLLLVWAALGVAVSRGYAQAPQTLPSPTPLFPDGTGATGTGPEILRQLPVIPDLPASLYQPAPPPAPPPPPADRPYFELDPSLNPPDWPRPFAWFGDVQLGYVTPHIKDVLIDTVANPAGRSDVVTLPTAPLGWVVSPYFTVGYRMGEGAGSLSLSYRFLDANGTTTAGGLLDGLASLRTRLDVQQVDFVYSSREYTPSSHWFLKWSLGLRFATVFWDNQATEPFDVAAAGGGVFLQRDTNHYFGVGPLSGVEVTRQVEGTGLSCVGRLIAAAQFARLQQTFVEGFTALDANGNPQSGRTRVGTSVGSPQLTVQLGLDWRPPSCKAAHFFVGYQYEHWWDVGKSGLLQGMTAPSDGELEMQGVVFQAGWNY